MGLSTTLTLKFSGAEVQKGLKSIAASLKGLGSAGASAGRTILAPFAKLMAVLAPLLGFTAIAKIGTEALQAASSMETLQVQFGALLKSQDAATDLISKLRKLNVESPLGLDDFAKGAKQLLGVRMSADESADALDKLSNISMGNSENFESLVRAFGQVKSAGRLMGQEVLQFVNAGFNPLAEISLRTGESMAVLKKRMEDGKISFQEVSDAIATATRKGGLFNGMNQKIAATTEGKIQKLKDGWNQLLIAFGTPVNTALKPMIDALTERTSGLADQARQFGVNVANALTSIVQLGQDGRLGELFGNLYEGAARRGGEVLVAVSIVAANVFGDTIIQRLKDVASTIWDILKAGHPLAIGFKAALASEQAGITNSTDFGAAMESSKNMFGSQAFLDKSGSMLNQGQSVAQVPMRPQAPPGAAAEAMEVAREQLKMLKGINQKLTPTP